MHNWPVIEINNFLIHPEVLMDSRICILDGANILSIFRRNRLVSNCLGMALFFLCCFAHDTINTYTQITNNSMNRAKQKGEYLCQNPFGLKGRPVFGGQIFSHIIRCAVEETKDFEVISGDCIFKEQTYQEAPIRYKSTVTDLGKTFKIVKVDVLQKASSNERITAVGTVILQKSKEAFEREGKAYATAIENHLQKDMLLEYFEENTTDHQKISKMKTLKEFLLDHKKNIEALDWNNIHTSREIYSDVEVRLLANKKDSFSRCIAYHVKSTEKASSMAQTQSNLSSIYTYIAFISDEYLLETALSSQGLEILSSPYNILTISHSIKYNDCKSFCLNSPFFYSVKIESIYNNIAVCKGTVIQNSTVYANISQIGKIIPRQNRAVKT